MRRHETGHWLVELLAGKEPVLYMQVQNQAQLKLDIRYKECEIQIE